MFAAAHLDVRLRSAPGGALPLVVASVHHLALAAIWGALCLPEPGHDIIEAKRILQQATDTLERTARCPTQGSLPVFEPPLLMPEIDFNPWDPLTIARQAALNIWLETVLLRASSDLYSRVFSFSALRIRDSGDATEFRLSVDLQSFSPCAPLLYGCMSAVYELHASLETRGSSVPLAIEQAISRSIGPVSAFEAVRKAAQVASVSTVNLTRVSSKVGIALAHTARRQR